jgi:hypothetical protein
MPGLIRHPDVIALDPGSEAGVTVYAVTVRKCCGMVNVKIGLPERKLYERMLSDRITLLTMVFDRLIYK